MTADSPDDVTALNEREVTPNENEEVMRQRKELEEEDLMHDPNVDESVPYL